MYQVFQCRKCKNERTYGNGYGYPDNQRPLLFCDECSGLTVHDFTRVSSVSVGRVRARGCEPLPEYDRKGRLKDNGTSGNLSRAIQ